MSILNFSLYLPYQLNNMLMKKLLILLLFSIFSTSIWADVRPTFGVKIYREVQTVIIEQAEHNDVIVELDAAELGNIFVTGVKVTVKDKKTKKKIYKKRFSNAYLYYHPEDNVYIVGKGDALMQVILGELKEENRKLWFAKIKEYGIY